MGDDYESTKLFEAMEITNNFTASLSEVCLLIIFNQLCVKNLQTIRRVSASTSGETQAENPNNTQRLIDKMQLKEMIDKAT